MTLASTMRRTRQMRRMRHKLVARPFSPRNGAAAARVPAAAPQTFVNFTAHRERSHTSHACECLFQSMRVCAGERYAANEIKVRINVRRELWPHRSVGGGGGIGDAKQFDETASLDAFA